MSPPRTDWVLVRVVNGCVPLCLFSTMAVCEPTVAGGALGAPHSHVDMLETDTCYPLVAAEGCAVLPGLGFCAAHHHPAHPLLLCGGPRLVRHRLLDRRLCK